MNWTAILKGLLAAVEKNPALLPELIDALIQLLTLAKQNPSVIQDAIAAAKQ